MTLIIGILCSDGVVMASDSAATFGVDGLSTIGQQEVTKVRHLKCEMLYSSTGAIGISQILADAIERGWEAEAFKKLNTPSQAMLAIGCHIAATLRQLNESATFIRSMGMPIQSCLCKSMLAMPVKGQHCLFQFDYGGHPEHATMETPFIALGSGQIIADPFLAFLKRLLWEKTAPTLSEGRLVAAWTLDHVTRTNPGGVGGHKQMALMRVDAKGAHIEELDQGKIEEHLQNAQAAEKALVDFFRPPPSQVPPVPTPA